nr:flagellin [Clostridium pasteurianum]
MEIDQLKQNINEIANNTEFNGVKLLSANSTDGSYYNNSNPTSNIAASVSGDVGDTVTIPRFNITTAMQDSNGNTLENLDITKENSVDENLNSIDSAIKDAIHARSVYGGLENRFNTTYNNTNEISDKLEETGSDLSDADIASEIMEYSKSGILISAGIAMMAQTNKFPQDILNILSRIK